MATLTVYADLDGHAYSNNAVYATARSGSGLAVDTAAAWVTAGQYLSGGVYWCFEDLFSFDTSALPDTAGISAVDFSLYLDSTNGLGSTKALQANFGASITTADWIAGASLSGLNTVATRSSVTVGAYNDYTESGSAFRSAINKTGATQVMVVSSAFYDGTAPTGFAISSGVRTSEAAGTTQDPKLVVTYVESVVATPGLIALTATKYAPTVAVTDNVTATPPLLELAAATFAPSALTPELITPDALPLGLTAYVPGVAGGTGTTVTPGLVAFTTSLFAPTVTGIGDVTATPGVLAMTVGLFAPLIIRPHLSLSMPGGIITRPVVIPGGIPTIVSRDGGIPNRVIIDGGIVST